MSEKKQCPIRQGDNCAEKRCMFWNERFGCVIVEWMITGIEHNVNWK